MLLSFTKMNGAGNDFVVVDNRNQALSLDASRVALLCDRHRGVGADGVLAVEPSRQDADFRMRCFARFARRLGVNNAEMSFETLAGIIKASFPGDLVCITMSDPNSYRAPFDLVINGRTLNVHFLNTGVPHVVVFSEDIAAIDVFKDGAALRHHPAFAPRGANANFVQVLAPQAIAIRTYERGVEAETLACGTGVCAAALLHSMRDGAASPIKVKVRGGDILEVGFEAADESLHNVTLTGPADFVFDGTISL
jgi:diaminopimelate epimerase